LDYSNISSEICQIYFPRRSNISEIILAINSRSNETQADRFACDIGYGIELLDALYLLQKISIHREMKVMERIKSKHKRIAYRIRDLERLEDGGV